MTTEIKNTSAGTVLTTTISLWKYVIGCVILCIFICAYYDCEFSYSAITKPLSPMEGLSPIMYWGVMVFYFMDAITPLLMILMLNALRKRNALLHPACQVPEPVFKSSIYLLLALWIVEIALEINDSKIITGIGALVGLSAFILLFITTNRMRLLWRQVNSTMEAIGRTWFFYMLCVIVLPILFLFLGREELKTLSFFPDVVEELLFLYLFIRMGTLFKQLDEVE